MCLTAGDLFVFEKSGHFDGTEVSNWLGREFRVITVSMHTPSAADEIGKWALEQMKAKGIPPPAMVMVDKDRFLLDVVPVPKSTSAVDAVIAKAGGK